MKANAFWKKLGEVKKENWGGDIFSVANCLEMDGTEFCIQQFKIFFCLLCSQIICTFTFKFVPPPLFAFII